MPRYFFPASRAHHAYVMARDFGLEFERRFGKWEPAALLHLSGTADYRIYVHPDCTHILAELPEEKVTALRALGMWPESEGV